MKKQFSDLKVGSTLYGTYQKDWGKPTSEHILVKCKIVKNNPYDKTIDISDRYDFDPIYRTEHVNWIEIKANNINAIYQRDYSQSDNEKGYMLIHGLFTDYNAPELLIFTCKKDAVNYIIEDITEDIERHKKRIKESKSEIERLTKQKEKFYEI